MSKRLVAIEAEDGRSIHADVEGGAYPPHETNPAEVQTRTSERQNMTDGEA